MYTEHVHSNVHRTCALKCIQNMCIQMYTEHVHSNVYRTCAFKCTPSYNVSDKKSECLRFVTFRQLMC